MSLGGGRDQILEFPVLEPGVVGEMTLFADRGSDGMALDTEGNLYTTGGGADGAHVDVLDRTGRQIRTYPIPFPFVSNLVFGGPDLNQLWVTGTSSQLNFSEPLVPQMRPQTGHYGLLLRLDLTGVRGVATLPSKH